MVRPLKIGITGGIASGKSTAGEVFAGLGDWVVDADTLVHQAYDEAWLLDKLADTLPEVVVQGKVDFARLRQAICQDTTRLDWLETVLHPYVRRQFAAICSVAGSGMDYAGPAVRTSASGMPACVVGMVPLLFEAGFDNLFDKVLTMEVPQAVQTQRTLARPGVDANWLKLMCGRQLDGASRSAMANLVLSGELPADELRQQIFALRTAWLAEHRFAPTKPE